MKGAPFDKKPGLTFDKKLKDNPSVKGNTLDYYNDDMSRKAVGKLFNDKKTGSGDGFDDDFMGGYETATDRSKSSHASKAGDPEIPDETGEFIDLDELETYIQKKHVNISSVFNDPGDDEYDISLYQDKKKGTTPSASTPKTTPSTVKPATRPVTGSAKSPTPSSKYPSGSGRTVDKSPGSRFKLDSEYNTGSIPKAAIVSSEINSQIKVAALVIVVVFLAILAALVFKMNSLGSSLENANKIVEKYDPELETMFTQLKFSYEALELENKRLQSELDLATQFPVTTEPPTMTNPNNQEQPTAAPNSNTSPTPVPQQTGNRTYTTVKGDTLYGIALQFYGSGVPDNIKKIKDANNMTSDGIQVGVVLKIPE